MQLTAIALLALLATGTVLAADGPPSKNNGKATNPSDVARREQVADNGLPDGQATELAASAANAGDDAALASTSRRDRSRRARDHDIDVSIFWSSNADVDLRVKEPGRGGCDVWYQQPDCGFAFLVEDVVPSCYDYDYNDDTNEERIVWPRNTGNRGKYTVEVNYFSAFCGPRLQLVRLDAKSRGRSVLRKRFTLREGQTRTFQFRRAD